MNRLETAGHVALVGKPGRQGGIHQGAALFNGGFGQGHPHLDQVGMGGQARGVPENPQEMVGGEPNGTGQLLQGDVVGRFLPDILQCPANHPVVFPAPGQVWISAGMAVEQEGDGPDQAAVGFQAVRGVAVHPCESVVQEAGRPVIPYGRTGEIARRIFELPVAGEDVPDFLPADIHHPVLVAATAVGHPVVGLIRVDRDDLFGRGNIAAPQVVELLDALLDEPDGVLPVAMLFIGELVEPALEQGDAVKLLWLPEQRPVSPGETLNPFIPYAC